MDYGYGFAMMNFHCWDAIVKPLRWGQHGKTWQKLTDNTQEVEEQIRSIEYVMKSKIYDTRGRQEQRKVHLNVKLYKI